MPRVSPGPGRALPPRAPCTLLLAGVLFFGCGTEDTPDAAVQVSDSAGVRVVEVAAGLLDEPAPVRLAASPHLHIGAREGDETELFSAPIAAERLSDGRLFVVEAGDRRARLLDADGAFLRWVASAGDGPSEFRQASDGGVLDGDTLWIWDGGRRRLLFFHPETGFLGATPIEPPGGASRTRFVRPLPDGSILHAGTNLDPAEVMASDGTFQERLMVHLLDANGGEPRLAFEEDAAQFEVAQEEASGGRTVLLIRTTEPTFAPQRQAAADREGRVWSASGEAFELRRMSPEGELLEIVRVDAEPTRVTREIRDHYIEGALEGLSEAGREGQRAALEARGMAEFLPAFELLRTDDAGVLWVGEYVGHRPGTRTTRWWLAEPDGEVLGHVDLPPSLVRILHIGEEEILGVERDDLDVPYVVGYRLTR